MYDTVKLRLRQYEAPDINFLAEIPPYLDEGSVKITTCQDGGSYIKGTLGNLNVYASNYNMTVGDGSLSKWFLGDNYQTMTRKDVVQAVGRLEDTLHLSLQGAEVLRLDAGVTMLTRQSPEVYLKHLGELQGFKRVATADDTLYYRSTKGIEYKFYDKNQEQKSNKQEIPLIYKKQNVLRYEQSYKGKGLKGIVGRIVTASMLSDEAFYSEVYSRWQVGYKDIQKLNEIEPNFEAMRTKKDLAMLGVLAIVQNFGGELAFCQFIKEAQCRGELTSKQAFDLRQAVKEACNVQSNSARESEAMLELNKRVFEASRFMH